jgi:DNA mismatch repair ATPase MutS
MQVALIVYLAHVGCFVPADAATVGLADRIITRIVSQERLVMQQSTFMIDLTQVATMLRRATSRSLVIIDEFGKVGALPAAGQRSQHAGTITYIHSDRNHTSLPTGCSR